MQSDTVPTPIALILQGLGRLAVLYSGGADSESLLHICVSVLGAGNVLALTADTPLLAGFYRERTAEITSECGVRHLLVPLDPLSDPDFSVNDASRCYHCKRMIIRKLMSTARAEGFRSVADGTTLDDLSEDRPGLAAADEAGVLHPFVDASMGSSEVLKLLEPGGGCSCHPPSDSCLATRVKGVPLTTETVSMVGYMEEPLRAHVRGRVRIVYDGSGLELRYTSLDEELVFRNTGELLRRAAGLRLPLRLSRVD